MASQESQTATDNAQQFPYLMALIEHLRDENGEVDTSITSDEAAILLRHKAWERAKLGTDRSRNPRSSGDAVERYGKLRARSGEIVKAAKLDPALLADICRWGLALLARPSNAWTDGFPYPTDPIALLPWLARFQDRGVEEKLSEAACDFFYQIVGMADRDTPPVWPIMLSTPEVAVLLNFYVGQHLQLESYCESPDSPWIECRRVITTASRRVSQLIEACNAGPFLLERHRERTGAESNALPFGCCVADLLLSRGDAVKQLLA